MIGAQFHLHVAALRACAGGGRQADFEFDRRRGSRQAQMADTGEFETEGDARERCDDRHHRQYLTDQMAAASHLALVAQDENDGAGKSCQRADPAR